jgi:hypothetical protein
MRIGAKPIHLLHTLGQFILLTARSMHIATSLLGCATNDDGIGTTVADRDIADASDDTSTVDRAPSRALGTLAMMPRVVNKDLHLLGGHQHRNAATRARRLKIPAPFCATG